MSVRPMFFPRQAFLRLSLVRPALRMQGLPAVDAEGNPLVPGLPPAAGQTPDQSGTVQPGATPSALPLSSTPQPSYKLRLPTRR